MAHLGRAGSALPRSGRPHLPPHALTRSAPQARSELEQTAAKAVKPSNAAAKAVKIDLWKCIYEAAASSCPTKYRDGFFGLGRSGCGRLRNSPNPRTGHTR